MRNSWFFILLFGLGIAQVTAQIDRDKVKEKLILDKGGNLSNGRLLNDSLKGGAFNDERKIELEEKTHFTDYKIISYLKDTTIVDTTLSLKKERKFNYIRKDAFELLPLHNTGQTFNRLGYDFNSATMLPDMGMQSKYFNFYKPQDVNYYRVPTPTSELFFHTGLQQGHILNSLLTANLSPQFNLSIAYTGLRSLGDYRSALASHQNLRSTASYQSKNNRYLLRTHFTGQNIYHQENGGLTTESLLFYATNDEEYQDRERLETYFTDAENRLKTRGYYLEHGYNLWYHAPDSTRTTTTYLQIGHEFNHDRKFYTFLQDRSNEYFGDAYYEQIQDSTTYFKTTQTAFAELKAPWVLGKLRFNASHTLYNYGYNSALYLDDGIVPDHLKGHTTSIHAQWRARFKTIGLNTGAGTILEGMFQGNYLTGTAAFSMKDSLFTTKATLLVKSESPRLNMLLYQSGYTNYNWYKNLENEQTRLLQFDLLSDKLLDASVSFTNKDFYTYINENGKPEQVGSLSYLKIKANKEIRYWKMALNNTLLYQKVAAGNDALHIPKWVTENTLYYSDHVFKGDPLFIQAGVTLKYFTSYYADEYNPLLNEFQLQNQTKIGDFPLIDVFVNGQIQRTRLFLKAENVGSLWEPGKYYSTPTQPYRDFNVRFGVVWNFFI